MVKDEAAVQAYVDYLDKESTLVGLLATFAVAAGALLLQTTLGAKELTAASKLWNTTGGYISTAAMSCAIAALAFYRQRSHLAYYIGQIALARTFGAAPPEDQGEPSLSVGELLHMANAWSTWSWYQVGWIFLATAAVAFAITLVTIPFPWLSTVHVQSPISGALVVLAAAVAARRSRSLSARDAASEAPVAS